MNLKIFILAGGLLSANCFAQTITYIFLNCQDGTKSVRVTSNGTTMKAKFVNRNSTKTMDCKRLENTAIIRCQDEVYFLDIFKHATTGKMTAQLNLKGDFWPDSGYMYSLNCK
jgi:hypothetical protein